MNSLTFVVTNDIHFRAQPPRARLDDFTAALSAKVMEVFSIAQKAMADGIIISGDLTDTPHLGFAAVAELALLLSKSPCEIFTVAGQHDEHGHSPASLARTPYGLLRKIGIIRDVAEAPSHRLLGERVVAITGRHYNDDADRAEDYYEVPEIALQWAWDSPEKTGAKRPMTIIHIAHGCVVEREPGYEMRCTPIDRLKTSASVLCLGDYHPGTGIRRLNNEANTLTINVGALARLSAGAADMERTVQVALLQVDEDGDVSAKAVPLTSAKPGHEVLSRLHLEQQAQREERMTKFLDLLAAEGELTFLEVTQIVEDLAKRENIPAEIVKEALQRIGKARENMGVA